MINFDNLEKAITTGSVITLVVMVDGNELAAVSFKADTVAFQKTLEAVKSTATISIPDKKTEDKPKKKTPEKKEEELKAEKEVTEELEDGPDNVDQETGEIKEEASDKPLTREEIMAGAEEPPGDEEPKEEKAIEEEKPKNVQPTISENW